LAPRDDLIRFNISLIRQRGLELLQSLPASKRRLSEIRAALADAEIAQECVSLCFCIHVYKLAYDRFPSGPLLNLQTIRLLTLPTAQIWLTKEGDMVKVS
jgi:hypothetical protein